MIQAYGVSAHFTRNLCLIDPSVSVWHVLLDFITFTFLALFPWISTVNLNNLDQVQTVRAECIAVGYMNWTSITAVIGLGSPFTLTAPPMTRMSSLTSILLVNFISSVGDAFSLNLTKQDDIQFVGCLLIWVGVYNSCIIHTTIAHALTNHQAQY
jgi:hypothetical protein